jgi:hypothetical protein
MATYKSIIEKLEDESKVRMFFNPDNNTFDIYETVDYCYTTTQLDKQDLQSLIKELQEIESKM